MDTLTSLLPRISKHDIPVYISDNASTDGTYNIVKRFQEQYPHIFYSCNKTNLGPDRNFERVLKMSESRFAWLFSDDDQLTDGAVERVLDIVDSGDYALVVTNGGLMDKKKAAVTGRVTGLATRVYHDRNALLAELGWHMTWMSSLIFGRDMRQYGNFPRYYDTNLMQVLVVFDFLAEREAEVYWGSEPIVYGPSEGLPAWFDRTIDIWVVNWFNRINALPSTDTQEAKRACIMAHGMQTGLFATPVWFVLLRAHGHYNLRVYRKYKKYFPYVTRLPLIVLWLSATWPRFGARLMFAVYKRYRRYLGTPLTT
jgi:glycosyltransferase involved in cell wall biosynthesis